MPLREVLQRAPFNPAGVEIGDQRRAGVIENLSACPETRGQRLERRPIRAAGDSADAATSPLSHAVAAERGHPAPRESRQVRRDYPNESAPPSESAASELKDSPS